MKIILNIKQGATAIVYAFADPDEEGTEFDAGGELLWDGHVSYFLEQRYFTLHHSDHERGLIFGRIPQLYDNDQFIEFHSNVSFKEYAEKMEKSEFADPTKFHTLKHNCTHAAVYALRLAGIDLGITKNILFNRLGDRFFQRLPLHSLTPLDLFYLARDYKLKSLQSGNMDFKYELAQKRLAFTAVRQNAEIKKHVEDLIAADAKSKNLHPEHIEQHLQVLLETFDYLSAASTREQELKTLGTYVCDRSAVSWPGNQLAMISNLITFETASLTAISLLNLALSNGSPVTSILKSAGILTAAWLAVGYGLLNATDRAMRQPQKIQTNELSSAITNVMKPR
jgi:hypothetical protein